MTPKEKSKRERIVNEFLIFEEKENQILNESQEIYEQLDKLGVKLKE